MADVVASWSNTNDEGSHITVTLQNLTYDTSDYDEFSLELYQWDGTDWNLYDYIDYGPGEWVGGNSVYTTFVDNMPNKWYFAVGWAKYGGTWYDHYSDNIYPEIPQATVSFVSSAPHSITFSRSNTVGYLETYVYNYLTGGYETLEDMESNYSLSYSVSGNNVTIHNWFPNGWIDVIVETYLKINGSYTSTYSSKYNGFTSGALPIPSAPTLNHRLNVGFDLTWGYVSSAGFYQCRYKTTGDYLESGYFYGNTNQNLWVDDQWGTTYYVSVRSGYRAWNNQDYFSGWSNDNSATTAPKMCTIPSMNIGNDYIDFNFANFLGGWTRVLIEWSTDLSFNNSWSVYNPDTSVTITNLQQNTSYNFRVSVIYTVNSVDIQTIFWDGSTTDYIDMYLTTSGRPSNWNWITNISQGSATYGLDLVNKKIKIVSATEWNNFTQRINQFRTYKSLGSYSFTTVNAGDGVTSTIYNQARNSINDLAAYFTGGNTVPNSVSAGAEIQAIHFTKLRDALNSII